MAADFSGDTTGVVPDGYCVMKEGMASILQKGNDVFYNKAQVTNRDLSIAVLRHFLPMLAEERSSGKAGPSGRGSSLGTSKGQQGQEKHLKRGTYQAVACEEGSGSDAALSKGFRVLEGLAASGLRAIRYAKEIPGLTHIDANDLDPEVVDSMTRNIHFNGSDVSAIVHPKCGDARMAMMQTKTKYDVVDLDPYGTPSMFLDTAVQAVAEGGILMVTATDMANLSGNNPTACWSNYNCYPVHRQYCHEMAVRILLASIEANANRYRKHITPLISLNVDFYVRVFVRVNTSPAAVKDSACKLSYIWQSSGCDSFTLQKVGSRKEMTNHVKYMPGHGPAVPVKCPETGSGYLMGGPIWSDPMHDHSFVKGLMADMDRDKDRYAAYARIKGMLAQAAEELPDVPLYYELHEMCKTLKCQPPKMEVLRSAIINAGYRVSSSHANPLAVKTDAPSEVMWDILRCWIKDHPVNMNKVPVDSYLHRLLTKEPKLEADFTRVPAAVSQSKVDGVTRFVQNPAYWGPQSRHGRPLVVKGGGKEGSSAAAAEEQSGSDVQGVSAPSIAASGAGVVETEKERRHRLQMKSKGMVRRLLRQEERRKKMEADAAAKEAEGLKVIEPGNETVDAGGSEASNVALNEEGEKRVAAVAEIGEDADAAHKIQKVV
ncbi:hypothetical protein CEUSTIGMA_g8496.t1 [Chlamydomonas eustigma]|uniref:tRNA (guanine(26)-N(2))-dimethyltransferase n=1 Tax=Chlamydomonas eustigma TaxID=1157962 RepID=A0A250XDB2_9CHLO|nr:hypothetical protein CEUSTIGMA_g8496.t1 [Chlamydomonas eustigma]|eukprot:GAX81061.1 hypothetical protein CEUSTIGMA_g8496.t1 [Chlamydomonas eustigma]